MKKWFAAAGLALCLLLVAAPVRVEAATVASGSCGTGVTWKLDSDGVLTISGTGAMADYAWAEAESSRYGPWYSRRESISSVVITNGVTSIGNCAFTSCDELINVSIPDSVTSIGRFAFSGCVSLPGVTIPNSVTSIEDHAFNYCIELTSVSIPDSVTSIGEYAFYRCTGLTGVTIPNSVTSIEDCAFRECTSLVSVTIPDSVTSIEDQVFANCSSLTSVSIPDSVTSIGLYSFEHCSNLTSVNIPDSVTSIGQHAFWDCTSLTNVNIPNSVTSIGEAAFFGCTGLTSVTFPDSVTNTGYRAFEGCSNLTSVTIPDSVSTIDASTFKGCSKLTEVKIPKSVTAIWRDAFANCDSLTDVYYDGSQTEWKRIQTINVLFDLTKVTIHYTSHSVTFVRWMNDHPPIAVQTFTTISKATPPDPPTLKGYTFKGWHKEYDDTALWNFETDLVVGDITLCATWELNPSSEYTVTFNPNGGEVTPSTMKTGEDGKLPNLPEPTWEGHTFAGWYTAAEGGTKLAEDHSFTENVTIYAHWTVDGGDTPGPDEPEVITITFSANGGVFLTNGDTVTMNPEANGQLSQWPSVSWEGHTFAGWYTAAEGGRKLAEDHSFTESTTIYAHWTTDGGSTDPGGDDNKPGEGDNKPGEDDNKPGGDDDNKPGEDDNKPGGDDNKPGGDDNKPGDDDTKPDTPTPPTPAVTLYPIYISSGSGGNLSISHSSAASGTQVTITVRPWTDHVLDRLYVTNLDTNQTVNYSQRSSSEYTFTMPSGPVEVEASYFSTYTSSTYTYFTIPSRAKPGPTAWYYRDRHIYHVTDGLVPDNTLITRDMLLSVLYNLTDDSLIPVESLGSETNAAQVWATSNGILPDIYASGLWGLDKSLSREQTAMLVYGYARYRGYGTYQTASLTRYPDYSRVRPIARTAMSWVTATNLMAGSATSALSPQATLTCGQAGDLFYRFETTIMR